MKTSSGLALVLAVACAGAGCTSEANYCATWIHQSWTTNKAWRSRKWMYEGIACESSFKAGFKAGYRFANCGGDSCQSPGPSHFWSTGGVTEEDQRESQAWCDGFTHGTLAAQQDGNAMVSALDAQTAQPPAGVPEVYNYSGLGTSGSIGLPQGMGEFGQGQFAPGEYPAGQYSPAPSPPEPWAANRSTAAPSDVAHPPAAPASESMDRPTGNAPSPAPRYHGSAAFSGIGSLRAMVGPSGSVARLPDDASAAAVPPAPAPASAHNPSPYAANSPTAVPPKGTSEAVPSTLPTPSIQSAPTPQWELPIIRD
jgi:hypothetical protein